MEHDALKALADEIENLVFQYAEKQMEPPINPIPTWLFRLSNIEYAEKALKKAIKWASRAVDAKAKRKEVGQ